VGQAERREHIRVSTRPRCDDGVTLGHTEELFALSAPVAGAIGSADGPGATDRILLSLVEDLVGAGSGLQFVYRALDALADRYELKDAVVVVDDPVLGRQAFRAGRLPVGDATVPGDPLCGPTGVYAEPAVVPEPLARGVTRLCQLAVQLDVRRHDASHDALTGLFNRRFFDTMLEQSASRSARYGWPFALALVDLDQFKALNDRFGHHGGDQVLRVVGSELRTLLRAGDAAARVGGDEFALILANGSVEAVAALVDRVREAVERAMGVRIGFSAGVGVAPLETTEADELYRIADRRLYEAKHRPGERRG
jgi:diguanylate cyclase (GGDEF)-like protein